MSREGNREDREFRGRPRCLRRALDHTVVDDVRVEVGQVQVGESLDHHENNHYGQRATVGRVPPWEIVVLSGGSADKSDAWRTRRFDNVVLWNAAINDDGTSKGLPPEQVPDEPEDCVVFETVRRFKGLEREVVILVEVPDTNVRLDALLYVGLTRATTQLVVIAPPGLSKRLT
jgi:hypothetical protein